MVENTLFKLELFNNGPIVVFIWKNESGWPVESVTDNLLALYGDAPLEYISGQLHYADRIHPDDLSRVFQEVTAAGNNSECNLFTHKPYRYLDGFGKYRWVKDSSQIIRSENGDITHYMGYLLDISSEIEMNEETSRIKERLELAWKGAGDGLWDWNIDNDTIYFSSRWKEILGYKPEEFPNEVSPSFDAIHPEDQPRVEDLLKRHFLDPKNVPYEVDIRLRCKNGDYKWINARGKAIFDADGKPIRMTGIQTDISKNVALRQELAEQKLLYQHLVEFASDGIFIMNLDGSLFQCSRHAAEVLGYSMEEMKKLHVYDWDALHTKEEVLAHVRSASTSQRSFETKHRRKDGSIYNAAITAVKINIAGKEYVYASVRDITESKRLQIEVENERHFISEIMNNANVIIAVINQEGTMSRLNRYGEEFTGYTQDEVSSEPYFWGRFLDKEIQSQVIDIVAKAKDGNRVNVFQNNWTSRSGEVRMFKWSNTVVLNCDGEFDYLVTTGIDITELKNTMNTVAEKEQLLNMVLNSVTEGIYGFDERGNCIFVNEPFLRLLGYEHQDELLGKSIHDLIHHTRRDGSLCLGDECKMYKSDLIRESSYADDDVFWKRDGTPIDVEYWSHPIENSGYQGSIVTFLDITDKNRVKHERNQQEQQILQQSRLAQMGEMISMIAHQWRQPLAAISATTLNMKLTLLLKSFDLSTEKGSDELNHFFIEMITNIENYVENLTTTIDDFRNFYRPDKKLTITSFKEVIHKALEIIQSSIDMDNITIIEEYSDELQQEMYANEVMQVILNILKNSQDNFKEKKSENPKIKITSNANVLYIGDNGGGIPDEILDKIFDPYFTTKDEKNGSGLGLYMSKTIIQEHHHGKLSAKNQHDGVTFQISLNEKAQ